MIDAISTSSVQSSALRYIPQSTNDSSPAAGAVSATNFVTSRVRMDNLQNVAILEYISDQGQVVQQYPSQSQIRAFKRAEELQADQKQADQQQVAHQQAEHRAEATFLRQSAPSAPVAPSPSVQAVSAATSSAGTSPTSVPTTSFNLNTAAVVSQSAAAPTQSVLV